MQLCKIDECFVPLASRPVESITSRPIRPASAEAPRAQPGNGTEGPGSSPWTFPNPPAQ